MSTLVRLYAMGVDAMLVQDPGVAALAREIVPGLALHASTQLTIHNADGVRWAHAQGFSRVVLARELSLSRGGGNRTGNRRYRGRPRSLRPRGPLLQLLRPVPALIRDRGPERNRGMCAQPCRKKYTLVEAAVTGMAGRPASATCRYRTSTSSRQKTSARTGISPGSQTLRSHR